MESSAIPATSPPSAHSANSARPRAALSKGSGSGPGPDPVLRNTLRYTISAREYAALHKYVLSRSRVLRRATPSPGSVERALQPAKKGADDYNAKAVRHALRVFVATWLGMNGWDAVMKRFRHTE